MPRADHSSDPTAPDERIQRSLVAVITVASLLLITLQLLACAFPGRWLWGVQHSAMMPIGYVLVIAIVAIVASIPGLNSFFVLAFSNLLTDIAGRAKRRGWIIGFLAPAGILIVAALLFRSDNHLLGDGYTNLANLVERRLISATAPITGALSLLLIDIIQVESQEGAKTVFLIISVLAGIIFVAASWIFFRSNFKERDKAIAGMLLVLTAPAVQLFLGYTDNYSILHAWIVLFIVVCIRTLRGKAGPAGCVITYVIGIGIHLSFVAFFPALLWVFLSSRERFSTKAFYYLSAAFIVLMYLAGISVSRRAHSFFLLPYPNADSSYFLFSPDHLVDLGNLFLLTVPLVVFLFCLQLYSKMTGTEMWDRPQRCLVYMSLSALPFVFFVDPTIGAIRDWDLMALASTPILFSGVYYMLKRSASGVKLAAVVLPVFVVGIWHTGAWVYSNMDQKRAAEILVPSLERDIHYTEDYHDGERLVPLAVIASNSLGDNDLAKDLAYRRLEVDSAAVVAMDILQNIYRTTGKYDSAAAMIGKIVANRPHDSTYLLLYGVTLYSAAEYAEARDALLRVEPKPGDYTRDFYLGRSYLSLQEYDSSLVSFKRIYEEQPTNDLLNFSIGLAYAGLGDYESALLYLHRALDASPENPEVTTQLGNVFQSVRQYDSAEVYYRTAIRIDPARLDAISSLAFLYMANGRLEESIELWRRCIQLNPGFIEAYFFIGKMLRQLGREDEAFEALNATLQLQPGYTPALYHLALLYEDRGAKDSAMIMLSRIAEYDTIAASSDPDISAKLEEYGIKK